MQNLDLMNCEFFFSQYMNLKVVYLIFHDALFLLFDVREMCRGLSFFFPTYNTGLTTTHHFI